MLDGRRDVGVGSTAHGLKVPIAPASEWLLGFVAAVEVHVGIPQLTSTTLRPMQQGMEPLRSSYSGKGAD